MDNKDTTAHLLNAFYSPHLSQASQLSFAHSFDQNQSFIVPNVEGEQSLKVALG